MSANPDDYRFERKFYITDLSYHEVQHILKHHPSLLREIYHKRFINNIYFDTHHFTYYLDNVDGAADRLKVRIRWYGELFGEVAQPVLELKIKKGLVGTKKSFKLKPFVFDQNITIKSIRAWIQSCELPGWIQELFTKLNPALVNRYGRMYYQSANTHYRVTIDDNVTFYDIHPLFNNFNRKHIEREAIIVEVKYDQKYDLRAFDISKFFPYRMTKSSKYVNGMDKFLF